MTNVTLYDCLILDKKKQEACSSPLFDAFACSINLDVILQANVLQTDLPFVCFVTLNY